MEKQTLSPGIYFDCSYGVYNHPRVILLAVQNGFELEGVTLQQLAAIESDYYEGLENVDMDAFHDLIWDAEVFLSGLCPECYYFGCTENGDYGVFAEEIEEEE
jgi:hypothetical protein